VSAPPVPTRTYLVECYAPGIVQADVARAADRARQAALAAAEEGAPLAYLGALFVAEDDVVFHAFQADALEVVEAASQRAQLSFERIVESVSINARSAAEPPDGLLLTDARAVRIGAQA